MREDRHNIISLLRWLYPGMQVKRWLAFLLMGITILSLGFAYLLREMYPVPAIFYYLTLQFIPRLLRGLLFGLVGLLAVVLAIYQLNRSLLAAVMAPGQDDVASVIYRHRSRHRGPKIVAIGGGRGLSVLLRGLKEHTANLTAIITVGDDSGEAGQLREELGVLPPSDFRECLVALADAEPLVTDLFQYRFSKGFGLDGRSFGDLFIGAMEATTGDFEKALGESSRVLAIRGRILPSTLERITLRAHLANQEVALGEWAISHSQAPIERVSLQPENPPAYPETVKALREADMIIIGPGSLYTSILPNLLIKGIAQAIRASRALKVYICNVATQPGETSGYNVSDHVHALHRHVGGGLIHCVLANRRYPDIPSPESVSPVNIDARLIDKIGVQVIDADLVNDEQPTRHDPEKLAHALLSLLPR